MFSFTGDSVLDPFAGTGTTSLSAMMLGRSSISYEVEPKYVAMIKGRLGQPTLYADTLVSFYERGA